MKCIFALFIALSLVLLVGCASDTAGDTTHPSSESGTDIGTDASAAGEIRILPEGEASAVGISTIPEGFSFSFDGEEAKNVADCISALELYNMSTDPDPSMVWVISLEYKNGESVTLFYDPDGYIRTEEGKWYKASKGAAILGAKLDELCDLTGCSNFLDLPGIEQRTHEFGAQVVMTNGNLDSNDFPCYVVISSRAELDAYYQANKDTYDLEHSHLSYRLGFLDVCDKYDDAFFEESCLVLFITQETGSSIPRSITAVSSYHDANGALLGWDVTVSYEHSEGDAVTDDMFVLHYILELKKTNAINAGDDVHINKNHAKHIG